MKKPRIITFYLPQYHPIPENDEWWGKGFTDWRNVVRGKSRFSGHYQPHIPSELGFYDLRLEQTRIEQAELAKSYGIDAFCYYHYWFNGKMLLEAPFNEVLSSGKPDFPFCICWANENWTRRWDGLEHEILIQQEYEKYDPIEHYHWLSKAFHDGRYVRIKGKPLFIIYNASGIPNIIEKVSAWKNLAKKDGLEGLYVCSVKSVHNKTDEADSIHMGFDAFVDFIPNTKTQSFVKLRSRPKYFLFSFINKIIDAIGFESVVEKLPLTIVCDYLKLSESEMNKKMGKFVTFPCVIPSWDNSARKRNSTVIQNNDPKLYQNWLVKAIKNVSHLQEEEQIVFINAWNEWAEGCHLEPDINNGRMFLEATLNAIKDKRELKA